VLLNGKVGCVTGAASGIGRHVAHRFGQEGAAVMVADLDEASARRVAAEIVAAGGQAEANALDVTDPKSIEQCLAAGVGRFGGVDILVANAGIAEPAPVLEMTRESWERTIEVNLTGVFLCCQTFGRYFVAAGRPGRIIVTSSGGGKRGSRNYAAYAASKFGVIGFLQSLAHELAPHEINVNGVCPGRTATPLFEQLLARNAEILNMEPQTLGRRLTAEIPLGRLAQPVEVANAYVYLASPLADYVTGATLHVDGGLEMR
jgi:NAD(P)-dependent dehydrogenase (short-subunit alcohol dehydrogenase family)